MQFFGSSNTRDVFSALMTGLGKTYPINRRKTWVDILIERVNWNISILKLPWMDKPLPIIWYKITLFENALLGNNN
jgi:hypothetical protein